MHVFTLQLSRWREARNRDVVVMDTSVKTGFSIFKPTWDMVMGYKSGQISEAQYTEQYLALMNASWKNPEQRPKWLTTIESDEPTAIACFCKPGDFCHRHLLVGIFERLCKARNLDFFYYGEL